MSDFQSTISLDGIPIFIKGLKSLKSEVEEIFTQKQSPIQIITLNTDFLRIASKDSKFKEICQNAAIVVPDGIGITALLNLKYKIKVERITGNDILDLFLRLPHEQKTKIAFLGSSSSTLSILKNKIQAFKYNVEITSLLSPPYGFENENHLNSEIVQELKKNIPEILFVALGCPRQEKWISQYKEQVGFKVGIGIGAALDFFAGSKRRSPLIFRKIGMEWLWRLVTEPKRLFKRYILFDLPFFLKKVLELKVR